jgi:hypothetical protein
MRKQISKKTRFEVFKRDKFTCQYCGEAAPNVILHVDHIHPVSKGGINNILNLITSCAECNLGKRDKLLSDETSAIKQKKQLDEFQERQNQLRMIAQWQQDILANQQTELDIVNDLLNELMNVTLSDVGNVHMKKTLKTFGIKQVCDAIHIAVNKYYDGTNNGAANAIHYIGGICYNKKYNITYNG